jgi:hypothetical protein
MTPDEAKQFELGGRMCDVEFDEYQWDRYLTFAMLYAHYEKEGNLDELNLHNACVIEARVKKILDELQPEEVKDDANM